MNALALAVALANPIGPDAAACTSGGPAILVEITGLRDRRGNARLELYPANADDFLSSRRKLREAGKTFRRIDAPVPASGPISMCLRVPGQGRYAISFLHDRNANSKFDTFSDGAGFPSNRRLGRARPRLADGLVTVGPGVTRVAVRAQYLRGLGGFSPLG